MLEIVALFIGLMGALRRWHLCGIHIGATRERHGLKDKRCKSQKEPL